jgi:hypothetical protein
MLDTGGNPSIRTNREEGFGRKLGQIFINVLHLLRASAVFALSMHHAPKRICQVSCTQLL